MAVLVPARRKAQASDIKNSESDAKISEVTLQTSPQTSLQTTPQTSLQTTPQPPATQTDLLDGPLEPKGKKSERVPDGYYSRKMVMSATGYSDTDLRVLARQGIFFADKRNAYGWALYSQAMVDRIQKCRPIIEERHANRADEQPRLLSITSKAGRSAAHAYTTEEAAIVIERIEAGEALVRIFLDTKIHPIVINAIMQDYQHMQSSMFVPREILDKINRLPLEGSFPIQDAKELLAVMKLAAAALGDLAKCAACKKKSRTHCLGCARKMFAPAAPPGEATSEDALKEMAAKT